MSRIIKESGVQGMAIDSNGNIVVNSPIIFESGVVFGNKFTTPILTANQNNYSITDMKNYTIIKWRGSNDIDITGINSSGLGNDYAFLFINSNALGGKKFTFISNSGSSTAANRFQMVSNIKLNPGDFWWFVYDVDIHRWLAQAKI